MSQTLEQPSAPTHTAPKLTHKQTNALLALWHTHAECARREWVTGSHLDRGHGRLLSGLIEKGLVEGRKIVSAKSSDYKLTAAGREYARGLTRQQEKAEATAPD